MPVIIRSVQQAAITSGGPTQDFQHSDFTSLQPVKAAIVFGTNGVTNGTQVDHGLLSVGFTDGTSQFCGTLKTRDAQAVSSQCDVAAFNNLLFSLYNPANDTQDGSMGFSSFAADKLVGTWSDFPPAAWLTNAVLLGGSHLSVYAGTTNSGTTVDSEITVTDPNFQVDAIMMLCRGTASFDNSSVVHAMLSVGWAVNDGGTIRQGCVVWRDTDAVGNQAVVSRVCSNRTAKILGGTNDKGAEVSAFLSNGFKFFLRDATGGSAMQIAYLALGFNNSLVGSTVRIYPTITSVTTDTWTTPGHAPQAVFGAYSQVQTADADESGADAGSFGVGIMTGASEEFSSAILSVDAAATSNTKSLTNSVGHEVPQGSGSAGTKFDLSSFNATGATFNHTVVLAAARQQVLAEFGRNKVEFDIKGGGESTSSLEPVRLQSIQALSHAEAFALAESFIESGGGSVEVELEGRGLGAADVQFILAIAKRLEANATAESFSRAELNRVLFLEARLTAEASGRAEALRILGIQAATASESTGSSAVGRAFRLEARDSAESTNSAALSRVYRAEARSTSESSSSAALGRALRLEGRGSAEATPKAEINRLERLEARGTGEASPTNSVSRLFALDAKVTNEAFGILDFRSAGLLLECRTLGESDSKLTLNLLRGMPGVGLGESTPYASVGVSSKLEGRGLGEASPKLELVRLKPLDLKTTGEATSSVGLTRAKALELLSIAEGNGVLALAIKLGASGQTIGEALSTVTPGLRKALEARTLGEGNGFLLVVESTTGREIQLIYVVREKDIFVIKKRIDLMEIQKELNVIKVL